MLPCGSDQARRRDGTKSHGIETNAAAWCNLAAIADLVMHPAMRQRLQDAITELHQVRIA